jgi:hypothetical protein
MSGLLCRIGWHRWRDAGTAPGWCAPVYTRACVRCDKRQWLNEWRFTVNTVLLPKWVDTPADL